MWKNIEWRKSETTERICEKEEGGGRREAKEERTGIKMRTDIMHSLKLCKCSVVLEHHSNHSCSFIADAVAVKAVQWKIEQSRRTAVNRGCCSCVERNHAASHAACSRISMLGS
jgi:hypothetical protein